MLLAALRGRATKVSGNYILVDGCWFLLVDWDERSDVERPKIPGLPAVLYFVNGHERLGDRVIGFGNRVGELENIVSRHPQFAKRPEARVSLNESAAYPTALIPSNCPCGSVCGCLPGSQCGCLSGTTMAAPFWYGVPPSGVTSSAGIRLFGTPIVGGSIGTYPTDAP